MTVMSDTTKEKNAIKTFQLVRCWRRRDATVLYSAIHATGTVSFLRPGEDIQLP